MKKTLLHGLFVMTTLLWGTSFNLNAQSILFNAKDITEDYLVEAENFTRSEGQGKRFGKPAYWTVDNFNIPNGGNGTKQGLDKHSELSADKEALMLGVWNDGGNNTEGDISNARIYRKITLPAGDYYFGASYNTTYNMSENAYMFVSEELCNTSKIPSSSIAYFNINKIPDRDLKMQGFYFSIAEEKEVYLGFQADLSTPAIQEFRAERVALYTNGTGESEWEKLTALPDDVSQYFFAIYDHDTHQILALEDGVNQGSYKTMWYKGYSPMTPESSKNTLWTFDDFDKNYYNITSVEDVQYTSMQTLESDLRYYRVYTDDHEGWADRAGVIPSYEEISGGCWTLVNYKARNSGDRYIGHWDATDEIMGNRDNANKGKYDFYAVKRGKYVAMVEDIYSATEDNPIDISYVITNASATRGNTGNRKVVGWNQETNNVPIEYGSWLGTPAQVGSSYFNIWQSPGSNLANRRMSQTLTDLPAGRYRVSVRTNSSNVSAGAYLFANDDEPIRLNTVSESNVVSVVTNVTNGTLEFGVKLDDYKSNNCKFDHFTLEYLDRVTVPVTLGTNGYATFASPYALDLAHLPEGLTAYKAAIAGTTVTFTGVAEAVQANTGLLLKGDASESYNIPVAASGSDISSSNAFYVNTAGTTFSPDANTTYYGLLKNTLTFATFNPSGVAIPSNKAYLKVVGTGARLTITFDDEDPTAINAVDATEIETDGLKDGKYLEDGKIVIVKNGVKYSANGQILK